MSNHIQQTIRTLEQEIEAMDQRRGDLVRAIDALRPLAGVVLSTPVDAPRTGSGSAVAPASNGNGVLEDRILATLRAQGPLSPKALGKIVKLDPLKLRKHLKALARTKLVELTGSTMNRQVSLPRKAAAKEAI